MESRKWLGSLLVLLVWASLGTNANAQPPRCADPILAMTYNIRLDTQSDGANAWAYRREHLIGQIQLLRPTVLGMQEVLPNQRADLETALPNFAFVGGGRDDGALQGEASPIAVDRSRLRILSAGTFWLSPTPQIPSLGWDAAFRRVATWARVKRNVDGARLLLINTHWDHVGKVARVESGKQLASWIKANRKSDETVIVLGDFNTDAKDPAVANMALSADLTSTVTASNLGLAAPSQSSFNNYDPFPVPGNIIDHIFVSKGMTVARAMVLAMHDNGRVASDHFPVAALLRLPGRNSRTKC